MRYIRFAGCLNGVLYTKGLRFQDKCSRNLQFVSLAAFNLEYFLCLSLIFATLTHIVFIERPPF